MAAQAAQGQDAQERLDRARRRRQAQPDPRDRRPAGACIFHNRADFAETGDAGCRVHALALRRRRAPLDQARRVLAAAVRHTYRAPVGAPERARPTARSGSRRLTGAAGVPAGTTSTGTAGQHRGAQRPQALRQQRGRAGRADRPRGLRPAVVRWAAVRLPLGPRDPPADPGGPARGDLSPCAEQVLSRLLGEILDVEKCNPEVSVRRWRRVKFHACVSTTSPTPPDLSGLVGTAQQIVRCSAPSSCDGGVPPVRHAQHDPALADRRLPRDRRGPQSPASDKAPSTSSRSRPLRTRRWLARLGRRRRRHPRHRAGAPRSRGRAGQRLADGTNLEWEQIGINGLIATPSSFFIGGSPVGVRERPVPTRGSPLPYLEIASGSTRRAA